MTHPVIAAELRRIAEEHNGELKPIDVVQAAEEPTSPLHPFFDWADDEAARKWRLHQARNLIRVVVDYVGPTDNAVLTRVFVSLRSDRTEGGVGYRSVVEVLSNTNLRQQLLEDALGELERFRQKYEQLEELAEVFSSLRKIKRPQKIAAD